MVFTLIIVLPAADGMGIVIGGKCIDFQVLLIDYGVECDALPSRIRELPEYFSKIPPFALRAHLDVYDNDNQLMPLGFSWGEKACEVWRGVIEKLDSQSRVCYAWRLHQGDTKSGGVLKFDFFNQVINFQCVRLAPDIQ